MRSRQNRPGGVKQSPVVPGALRGGLKGTGGSRGPRCPQGHQPGPLRGSGGQRDLWKVVGQAQDSLWGGGGVRRGLLEPRALTDVWREGAAARRRAQAWGAGKDLGSPAGGLPEPQRELGGALSGSPRRVGSSRVARLATGGRQRPGRSPPGMGFGRPLTGPLSEAGPACRSCPVPTRLRAPQRTPG